MLANPDFAPCPRAVPAVPAACANRWRNLIVRAPFTSRSRTLDRARQQPAGRLAPRCSGSVVEGLWHLRRPLEALMR